MKFTAVRADYFDEVDLSRYNVIILPDGSANGYQRYLGEAGTGKLINWIRSGGVAIGLKEGARYFTLGENTLLHNQSGRRNRYVPATRCDRRRSRR